MEEIHDEKYKILEDIGLSWNEIKVYLKLIQLGLASAGQTAEKLEIHRPNVYDALDKLVAKGLVSYIYKEEKKHYQINNPETLLCLLKEKEIKLKQLVPELKAISNLAEKKTKAYLFEKIKGIKAMTDDQLTDGKDVFTFGIPKDVCERMKSFINIYHERRIRQGMKQFHLYNENAQERISYLNTLPHTKAAFLPKEYDSPATTNVYGDKVSFFIWAEEPFGVIIEDKRMADSYRRYFKLLWKIATEEEIDIT